MVGLYYFITVCSHIFLAQVGSTWCFCWEQWCRKHDIRVPYENSKRHTLAGKVIFPILCFLWQIFFLVFWGIRLIFPTQPQWPSLWTWWTNPARKWAWEQHHACKQTVHVLCMVVTCFYLKHHGKTPGSTIFQGKVNPTQCEALTMVCAQVPYLILWKRILLFALSSWWRAIAYLKNNYSSHIYLRY